MVVRQCMPGQTILAVLPPQNIECFGAVNDVCASFFSSTYPARSCVQMARLPKDALVEIEAIALHNGAPSSFVPPNDGPFPPVAL